MSNFNSQNNRAVWFDIPVADLDRAAAFYRAILGVSVEKDTYGDFSFCIIEHKDGNGGWLAWQVGWVDRKGVITPYAVWLELPGDKVDTVRAERERRLRAALAALGLFPDAAR